MNDDQINDLKQFIAATVSQATAPLATKEEISNLATKDDFLRLEQKVDDGFAGIGDIVAEIHVQQEQLEQQVVKLEEQAA